MSNKKDETKTNIFVDLLYQSFICRCESFSTFLVPFSYLHLYSEISFHVSVGLFRAEVKMLDEVLKHVRWFLVPPVVHIDKEYKKSSTSFNVFINGDYPSFHLSIDFNCEKFKLKII